MGCGASKKATRISDPSNDGGGPPRPEYFMAISSKIREIVVNKTYSSEPGISSLNVPSPDQFSKLKVLGSGKSSM